MKKIFVSDLKAGQPVEERFLLTEKNIARKKDGGAYITASFSDKTGIARGVIWDEVEKYREGPGAGDYVLVCGEVSEYRGVVQIVVSSLARLDPDSVDPVDFMPASRRDPESMLAKLASLSETVRNPYLNRLLRFFLQDAEFVNRFKTAPAAKHMHHAYLGGLLEHTLSLTLLADRIGDHYGGIDRDLLLTGAILHDIGKTREFTYDRCIDYSDEGRMVSHIVIGVEMVQEKIAAVEGFPKLLGTALKHMLISHHGSREYGSPEPPKTLEAVMLNYLDEIDSKINGIREFMEKQDTGGHWTGYHRPLARHFYIGPVAEPGADDGSC